MLLHRLAAMGDQAVMAASNFLLTLLLARAYEPVCLAGFAIGTTLALLVQGIYRSSLVLPASLFEIGSFRARAARLAGRHVVLMTGVVAFAAVAGLAVAAVDGTPLSTHAAAAAVPCVLLFVPIDFDRMLTLRLGFRMLPLWTGSAYLALLGILSLTVKQVGLSFFSLMAVLGCFCLVRIVLYAVLLVRPDFRRVGVRLRIDLRRNMHWGALGTIATGTYTSMPLLLLGWSAPALNVAAYNAMRNLTQPLQLLLRSFDVIDKLTFSTLDRSNPAEQRSHLLFVLVLYAALSGAFTALVVAIGGPLTRLTFGARYDGFGSTLILWSVVTGLTSCLAPLETVIYWTGQLRTYALLQTAAGGLALLVTPFLILHFRDLGAVAATMLGTTITFLGLIGICLPFLGLRLPAWPLWSSRRRIDEPMPGSVDRRHLRSSAARAAPATRDRPRASDSGATAGHSTHGRKPMPEISARRFGQPPSSPVYRDRAPTSSDDDVARFFGTLRRHRRSIAAVALALPVIALVLTFAFPFRYTAWSEISIDPRGQRTTDSDIVPSGYGNDVAISDSQIKIITSDSVLLPVVRDLHLAADPDFGPNLAARMAADIGRLLGSKPAADEDRELEALRVLRQRVTAKRAERTYIIDIGVASDSPERAAVLAQAVTKSYLADHQRAEVETVRSVANFLSSRLDDLRTSLIDAEKRVEDYKESHHLVTVNDIEVTVQQLSDLNAQLATASAREAQAQARLDAINRIRTDKSDPGALAAALNSPVVNELRKQAAEVGRSEAMMAATLGPRHPALNETHQQIARIKGLIGDELRRIAESAGADLGIARGDEAALKRKIAALQVATMSTNRSLVGLRELQREVEARRGTYQAFLSRSQTAGEQENATVTNLRVISPASTPDRRDGPGRAVLAIVTLLVGALIGIGQALIRDGALVRSDRARRDGRAREAGVSREDGLTSSL